MNNLEIVKEMFLIEIERLIAQMKSCYVSSRYKFKVNYKNAIKKIKFVKKI